MTRSFELPDIGEGIHEAEIEELLVAEGDEVEEDQTILRVETDKASVDIPSPFSGTVQEIMVQPGDIVAVGDTLISFSGGEGEAETEQPEEEAEKPDKEEKPKEQEEAEPKGEEAAQAEEGEETEAKEKKKKEAESARPAAGGDGRPVPASPATRRLARELEVDLRQVPASGPEGRVTAEDVRTFAEGEVEAKEAGEEEAPEKERAAAKPAAEKASPLRPSAIELPPLPDFNRWGETERVPLRSIRRATAKKMVQAWSQIPQALHHDRADITELDRLRREQKEEIEEGSLTLTLFVMKAAAAALAAYPRFNATLDVESQEIILKRYYDLGLAVDTERGLLVPVIRNVKQKSLAQLAEEFPDVVKRAQEGGLSPEEMQGGTFTITNVGILGGTHFEPIVNYPQVAILGMAQAAWQPVVQIKDGEKFIVPRFMLPLVLAFDHRVVDGADAGRFMNMIIETLEDPDKLMLRV